MEVDIVSRAGWSVTRLIDRDRAHFVWTEKDKDNTKAPLIAVLLHCSGCGTELEQTLTNLYGRYRIACTNCSGVIDSARETTRCLLWVAYRCLNKPDLPIDQTGWLFAYGQIAKSLRPRSQGLR